jgi:hypothetical protein
MRWVALGGALLACAVPVPFAEQWLFSTDRSQLPRAADCQRCHGEVYEEWRESPHAHAWSSPGFAQVTAGRSAQACLSCHAPGPLGAAGEIALRSDHRDEGVTCVTCHLSTSAQHAPLTMRGPHARTSPVEVHPLVQDPLFLKPELCGTCHAEVLEQWRHGPAASPEAPRETCQGCHMPEVRRKIESYDPEHPYSALIVALGDAIEGRRHSFSVPEPTPEQIELRAARPAAAETAAGGRLRVEVHNHLPHAIPTGAFGRRELRLRVSWPGGEAVERLRADLDQAIAAQAVRAFGFPQIPPAAAVRVVLERWSPGQAGYQPLAELSVGPGSRP